MIINTVVFTNSITCICICIYVLYLAMDTRRKFSRVDKASSPSSLIFYRLLLVGCYSVIFYFCLSDDADLSSLILSIYASIFNINVCNCIIKVFFSEYRGDNVWFVAVMSGLVSLSQTSPQTQLLQRNCATRNSGKKMCVVSGFISSFRRRYCRSHCDETHLL